MDLLGVEDSEAIVSVTNLATANDRENGLLASFRSQEPRRRMEIKIRTVEGQSGELQVYVVATPEPKTAQMIRVTVHPLSLHSRIEAPKASRSASTRNRLELSGFSSLNQVNEWLRQAFPDFPGILARTFHRCIMRTASLPLFWRLSMKAKFESFFRQTQFQPYPLSKKQSINLP